MATFGNLHIITYNISSQAKRPTAKGKRAHKRPRKDDAAALVAFDCNRSAKCNPIAISSSSKDLPPRSISSPVQCTLYSRLPF